MPRDNSMFCKHCGQVFDTKAEKHLHAKRCTEGDFPCKIEGCSSVYKSKNSLGDHTRLAHSDHSPDNLIRFCQVCHTWFQSSYGTTTHIYQEHKNYVWRCQAHVDRSVKCEFKGGITRKSLEDHIADKHPHHTFEEMAISPTKRLPKAAKRVSSSRLPRSSRTTSPPSSLSSSPAPSSTQLSDHIPDAGPAASFNALGSAWFSSSSTSLSSLSFTPGFSSSMPSNLLDPASTSTSFTSPSESYHHPESYQPSTSPSASGMVGEMFSLSPLSDSAPPPTQARSDEPAFMPPFDFNDFLAIMQTPAFPLESEQLPSNDPTFDQWSPQDIEALLQGVPLDLGFSNNTATPTPGAPTGFSLEDLTPEDQEFYRALAALP